MKNVLLIGDSIRMGYDKSVKKILLISDRYAMRPLYLYHYDNEFILIFI